MHRRRAIIEDLASALADTPGITQFFLGDVALSDDEIISASPLLVLSPMLSKSAAIGAPANAPRSTRRTYALQVLVCTSSDDFRAGRLDAISEGVETRIFGPGVIRPECNAVSLTFTEEKWDFQSFPGFALLAQVYECQVQQADNQPAII